MVHASLCFVLKFLLSDVSTTRIPHEVILREADHWVVDLIVTGKLDKRGVNRTLLGSVAERVIKFTRLPVMLAPTRFR